MPKLTIAGAGAGKGRGAGRGSSRSTVAQAWERLIDNPSYGSLSDFEIAWQNSPVSGSLFSHLSPGGGMHKQTLGHARQALSAMRAGGHVSSGDMARLRHAHAAISKYGSVSAELHSTMRSIQRMRSEAPGAPNWQSRKVENTLEKIQRSTAESARSDKRIAKEMAIPRVPRGAASIPTGHEPAGAAGGGGRGGGRGPYRPGPGGYGGGPGGRRGGLYAWRYRGLTHAAVAGAVGGASADLVMEAINAVKDIANAPQSIGRVIGGLGNSAAPAMNLRIGAANLGRAGGFSGRGLYSGLFPGGYKTPAWMRRYGVTPGMASDYLQHFGIVPHSSAGAVGIARGLRRGELSPSFAGMPSGLFRHGAAEAASMGLISPTGRGINAYATGGMGRLMAEAIAKGADRATIFRHMDQSLRALAQYGGAVSIRSNASMIGRFASLGTPSGMSGQAGLSAMTSASKMLGTAGHNPITTLIESRFLEKHGGSMKALGAEFNRMAPGSFKGLMANKVSAQDLRYAVQAQHAGNTIAAEFYLNAAISGNGKLAAAILTRGGRAIMGAGAPGYMKTAGAAFAFGGASNPQALNRAVGYGLTGNYHLPSGGKQSHWLGAGGGGFDPLRYSAYDHALRKMGVPTALRHALMDEAGKKGVNPLMAASVMRQENGGKWGMIHNPHSSAIGPGQTTLATEQTIARHGGPSVAAQRHSASANVKGAVALFAIRRQQFYRKHGYYPTARELGAIYHGGPGGYHKYLHGADANAAAGFGSGMPSGVYAAQAKAGQAEMEGASSSLVYFKAAADGGADALHTLTAATKEAAHFMSQLKNPHVIGDARFQAGMRGLQTHH